MKYLIRRFSRGLLSRGLLALTLSLAATISSLPAAQAAPVLQVAAAADLASCIDALNTAFAKSLGGADIKASIGSSGNFYAQISNGAPFDVFLSADSDYPRALAKAGFADGDSLMIYAYGQLVLWSNDPQLDVSAGWRVLSNPKVQRVAIANPDLAPYGRAARAALQQAGLWDSIKPKLVLGESIAQTAQFISTGNAQVGLVGSAHIRNAASNSVWKVPAALYPRIEQGAIVTAKGRANPLAAKYLDFLRSNAGRAILLQYGFSLPDLRG